MPLCVAAGWGGAKYVVYNVVNRPWQHNLSIAQLVERRTVVGFAEILRSLVRIRLEGQLFFSQGLFSPFFELQKNCAPGEARTHDLQITLAIDSL